MYSNLQNNARFILSRFLFPKRSLNPLQINTHISEMYRLHGALKYSMNSNYVMHSSICLSISNWLFTDTGHKGRISIGDGKKEVEIKPRMKLHYVVESIWESVITTRLLLLPICLSPPTPPLFVAGDLSLPLCWLWSLKPMILKLLLLQVNETDQLTEGEKSARFGEEEEDVRSTWLETM